MRYTYLADRHTADALKGMQCDPVRRSDGKCVRGRNGSMLVQDSAGGRYVVIGRRLRVNAAIVSAANGDRAQAQEAT